MRVAFPALFLTYVQTASRLRNQAAVLTSVTTGMIHQAFGTKSSTARAHMKLENRILDFLNGEEIGDTDSATHGLKKLKTVGLR